KMAFFGDDPFDEIVREFFGRDLSQQANPQQNGGFIRGEKEERNIDYVEDEKYVYLIFEIPGFSEKDVSVNISGKTIEINTTKSDEAKMQDYLAGKLRKGTQIRKTLPEKVKTKNFQQTIKNGILELTFHKK
ncbi:MAG TPA: Hsp20/alpha crystallin family protein, partial [Candidatus Nanoarchaeia archaeon]|nr:Hsp20/alpha crystallin family protein [Candidatus Nanoarchaeia archaeon]